MCVVFIKNCCEDPFIHFMQQSTVPYENTFGQLQSDYGSAWTLMKAVFQPSAHNTEEFPAGVLWSVQWHSWAAAEDRQYSCSTAISHITTQYSVHTVCMELSHTILMLKMYTVYVVGWRCEKVLFTDVLSIRLTPALMFTHQQRSTERVHI